MNRELSFTKQLEDNSKTKTKDQAKHWDERAEEDDKEDPGNLSPEAKKQGQPSQEYVLACLGDRNVDAEVDADADWMAGGLHDIDLVYFKLLLYSMFSGGLDYTGI